MAQHTHRLLHQPITVWSFSTTRHKSSDNDRYKTLQTIRFSGYASPLARPYGLPVAKPVVATAAGPLLGKAIIFTSNQLDVPARSITSLALLEFCRRCIFSSTNCCTYDILEWLGYQLCLVDSVCLRLCVRVHPNRTSPTARSDPLHFGIIIPIFSG